MDVGINNPGSKRREAWGELTSVKETDLKGVTTLEIFAVACSVIEIILAGTTVVNSIKKVVSVIIISQATTIVP